MPSCGPRSLLVNAVVPFLASATLLLGPAVVRAAKAAAVAVPRNAEAGCRRDDDARVGRSKARGAGGDGEKRHGQSQAGRCLASAYRAWVGVIHKVVCVMRSGVGRWQMFFHQHAATESHSKTDLDVICRSNCCLQAPSLQPVSAATWIPRRAAHFRFKVVFRGPMLPWCLHPNNLSWFDPTRCALLSNAVREDHLGMPGLEREPDICDTTHAALRWDVRSLIWDRWWWRSWWHPECGLFLSGRTIHPPLHIRNRGRSRT